VHDGPDDALVDALVEDGGTPLRALTLGALGLGSRPAGSRASSWRA